MHISVLTPDKEIFDGQITSVKVPGVSGQFEVLNNHAPIVSALGEGQVRLIQENGEKISFGIEKGFIEVLKNKVALLVQGAFRWCLCFSSSREDPSAVVGSGAVRSRSRKAEGRHRLSGDTNWEKT